MKLEHRVLNANLEMGYIVKFGLAEVGRIEVKFSNGDVGYTEVGSNQNKVRVELPDGQGYLLDFESEPIKGLYIDLVNIINKSTLKQYYKQRAHEATTQFQGACKSGDAAMKQHWLNQISFWNNK